MTTLVNTGLTFTGIGLEFDHATGTLLAATGTGNEVYEVDPTTGATTLLATLSGTRADDLGFYPTCP